MRDILLPLAVCASLFLVLPGPAPAAGPDAPATPKVPDDEPAGSAPELPSDTAPEGGWLEAQAVPELGQTIIYVRFPDAAQGAAVLEFLDSAGAVRATSEIEISGGTGLAVWDGRDTAGETVPSDLYVARLSFAGRELSAPFVR